MCNNRPYGLSYYFFPDERFLIAQHKDTKSKKLVYFAGTVTECGVAYPLFVNRQRDAYVYTNPIFARNAMIKYDLTYTTDLKVVRKCNLK